MTLALIIIFTLLGSVLSVGLAAVVLMLRSDWLRVALAALIPYAIGTLLGAAFFGMIPHSLERLPASVVLPGVVAGILVFYVLEKFALWRHCHEADCETHSQAGSMILLGDSLHNFVDGVAIAAAFALSIPLGVTTSVAVIAHEVPQEVGDFAILLSSGYPPRLAFGYNLLSSLAALLGAVLTYALLPLAQALVPYLLCLSAASFIYIALADLVPGRRDSGGLRSLAWELPCMLLGLGTIAIFQASSAH